MDESKPDDLPGMKTEMMEFRGRFDSIDRRFDGVDRRFETVDQRFETVDQRFDAVDQRFDAVDQRFDAVDRRFEAVDRRFDRVEMRLDGLSQAQKNMATEFIGVRRDMDKLGGDLRLEMAKLREDVAAKLDRAVDRMETIWMESGRIPLVVDSHAMALADRERRIGALENRKP